MKSYARIALIIFLLAACTKSGSGSQEGKSSESIHEQENATGPLSSDQENASSKAGPEDPGSGQTPAMDPKAPTETSQPESGNVPQTPSNPNHPVTVEFGTLNFRQYLATLSTLTGVRLNAPAAVGGMAPIAEYARASANLPRTNNIQGVTPVHVSSMTRLSSVFCDVLANDNTLLEAKFPGLSLVEVPSDSLAFAGTLLTVFYGPETFLQAPRATDRAAVAAAVDTLKALPEATGTGIFVATCSALLSAAEISLY